MLASQVKQLVLDLVDQHDELDGVGRDPYHSQPRCHAMAEGKFLSAVSCLAKSGIISEQRFFALAGRSLERLRSLQLKTSKGAGFGLNFEYGGAAAETPYTITTSVVAEGLINVINHKSLTGTVELLEACRAWLVSPEILVHLNRIVLPGFAPRNLSVITNVVGFWSTVLGSEHRTLTNSAKEYVNGAYIDGLGWPYHPESTRYDLLHTCYASRGSAAQAGDSLRIATAVSKFVLPHAIIDKFDAVTTDEALRATAKARSVTVQFSSSGAIVLYPDNARLWSLGELLVVSSWQRRAGSADFEPFWSRVSSRTLDAVGPAMIGSGGPRDEMHLVHGLACHLALLRS